MKNKLKIVSVVLLVSLVAFTTYQISLLQNDRQSIVGVWKGSEDDNWRFEFTERGQCFWYYTNEPTKEYSYSIENTSPQCGREVDTGDNFTYLVIKSKENMKPEFCYEIQSLNNEFLQIRKIDNGKFFHFRR